MKKAGKVLLYVFLTLFFLIAILAVVAALSENKIARLAIDQIGKTTKIPIQVEEIDFSLIRNFPMASILCKELTVYAPNDAAHFAGDTLFHTNKFFFSVDVKPLLDGFFDIKEIELEQAVVYYKIDSLGHSNLDFFLDSLSTTDVDTASGTLSIDLKNFKISDLLCLYQDQKLNAAANLHLESLDIKGHAHKSDYGGAGTIKGEISGLKYPEYNLSLLKQLTFDVKGNFENDSVTIDRADLELDADAELSVSGKVGIADTIWADLIVQAKKLDLGNLSKYLPAEIMSEYGIGTLSGMLIADANVKGKLTAAELPSIDAAFSFSGGKLKYSDYPELKNISLSGEFNNGQERTLKSTGVKFQNFKFQTDSSQFALSGWVKNLDRPEFNIRSKVDVNLLEALPFLPDSMVEQLSGRMQAEFSTHGVLPDSISDSYIETMMKNSTALIQLINVKVKKDSSVSIAELNGTIDYQPGKIHLGRFAGSAVTPMLQVNHFEFDADLTGNPLYPDSLSVLLDRMTIELDNSRMQVSGLIKNISKPVYSLQGEANINLAEMSKFLPDSLVHSVSGNLAVNFRSAASLNLDSISDQMVSVVMENSDFDLKLTEINVDAFDTIMNVGNVNGALSYRNDTFRIEHLTAEYMGMKTAMHNVTATKIYAGAIQNKAVEINVDGEFYADKVDYSSLAVFMEQPPSANGIEVGTESPNYTYRIQGRAKTDWLKYEKAIMRNIDTRFLVKDSYYVIDSMTMDAFDGSAVSSAKIEMGANDEMQVWFKTNLKKMDVTQLVDAFGEYLEYEDIQKNNVRGTLSSVMDGKIVLKNYEPDYEQILLKGELTLENGALFNVKPVMEVEQISGVGIKNLDSLYFSTLSSSIFLFRNDVYIPRTEIRTSSFDAMFLGMYGFDEDYAYHIRMFLGEVLSSKSKANLRKLTQEGGFGEEDEKDLKKGRTSIYVVSKSENGKEKAGFDTKKDRSNMVARVNLQKQMLDMRFHPTLVSYSTEK